MKGQVPGFRDEGIVGFGVYESVCREQVANYFPKFEGLESCDA